MSWPNLKEMTFSYKLKSKNMQVPKSGLILPMLFFCCLFGIPGVMAQSTDPAIRAEILSANLKFCDLYAKGGAPVSVMYTSGAMLLPPNGEPIQGSANITSTWKAFFESGVKKARLETFEVESFGNSAVEVGKYFLTTADGLQADVGKYIVYWKKEDGNWKMHRDIWNSSLPLVK